MTQRAARPRPPLGSQVPQRLSEPRGQTTLASGLACLQTLVRASRGQAERQSSLWSDKSAFFATSGSYLSGSIHSSTW